MARDEAPDLTSTRSGYRSYVLGLTLIVYSFSYIDRTLSGILASAMKTDLGLSDTQLGLINGTAFALLFAVATVPFGWLADRMSRTRIISGAFMLWSVATGAFGIANNSVQLMLARAGVGLGEAAGVGSCHALLTDYFPYSQRARVMAIYGFGVPVGVAIGSAGGGWIAGIWGWRAAFLIAGVLGFLLALLFKLTIREPARVVLEGEASTPQPFFRSIRMMITKPGYMFVCFGCTFSSAATLAQFFWLPSYMARSFHIDMVAIAAIFGAVQLVGGVSGAAIGGYLSDRFVRGNPAAPALVAASGFLLACPFVVMVALASDARIAWAFFLLATIMASLGNGPTVAAVQYFASPVLRGTASAILTFCIMVLAMGLGVPLVGLLSDRLAQSYAGESLRYALLSLPVCYLTGGMLFMAATRWMTAGPGGEKQAGAGVSLAFDNRS